MEMGAAAVCLFYKFHATRNPSSLPSLARSQELERENRRRNLIPMAPSVLLLLLLFFFHFLGESRAATFSITNNCAYAIWPGLLSGAGTAPLDTTGFLLNPGESRPMDAPPSWSGRLWGRTLCSTTSSTGSFSCDTGDCGSGDISCSGSGASPPVTLAEFTLGGSGGMDFFDVSLVDGYNLPMLIVPQSGSGPRCGSTGCLVDLNGLCPTELRVAAADGSVENVACKSACEAFGSPQYCCSGDYGGPDTCKPSAYSQFFKNSCPRAYSYAYDDATSTFTCRAATGYRIIFCPSSTSLKSSGSASASNPQATGMPLINDTMVFLGGSQASGGPTPPDRTGQAMVLFMLAASWWLF